MAPIKAIDILKKILLSFRRNWGLKLVSLLFAVILWNYVIVEIDPNRPQTISVPVTAVGMTQLKNNSLTINGDIASKVVVELELKRSQYDSVSSSDITVTADFTNITRAGKNISITLKATSTKGTVKRVSPSTITVSIEKRDKRGVPVSCSYINELPGGYLVSETEFKKTLEISGAISEIEKVARAEVSIDLTGLTEDKSTACKYKLYNTQDEEIVNTAGLEFTPSDIVSVKVLKKKTVRIDAENAITGKVAKGYVITAVTCDPETVEIAGQAGIIDAIETLKTTPVNVDGETGTQIYNRQVKLPQGVQVVGGNNVDVTVTIAEKTVEKTLDKLAVSVVGLGAGLKVEAKFYASAVITCPELIADRIQPSKVRLFVDATGLEAGSHTLKIHAEYADGVRVEDIEIDPENLAVQIKAAES